MFYLVDEGAMTNPEIDALKKAAKGLVYRSEADEPLHTFSWEDDGGSLTSEKVLKLSKSHPETKVEEVSLDDVFGSQTEGYEGQSANEKERVERYKSLLNVVNEQLSDVKAFRVGEPNVRYYVVGRTKQGDWAGVWTKAVET